MKVSVHDLRIDQAHSQVEGIPNGPPRFPRFAGQPTSRWCRYKADRTEDRSTYSRSIVSHFRRVTTHYGSPLGIDEVRNVAHRVKELLSEVDVRRACWVAVRLRIPFLYHLRVSPCVKESVVVHGGPVRRACLVQYAAKRA